jgi:phenylacetic acid degradation protein paaN
MKQEELLKRAIQANSERVFYAQYPEHPKAYGENGMALGEAAFKSMLNNNFDSLLQPNNGWIGQEQSPYTMQTLGVKYPLLGVSDYVQQAATAQQEWSQTKVDHRVDVLIDSLDAIKEKFFEIAFATQHTTGQSFMMSFQASGPHANDRAMEAIAAGYEALTQYPENVIWEKPMGKFSIKLKKSFVPVSKGIGLVIGCSTFPIWNTLPGVFANLIAGNAVIIKPHPMAVLPIAIVVAAMQHSLKENGVSPLLVQLAADTNENLITKELAENNAINLIDYTGSNTFGNYIESLSNKTIFTEKAGVNSVIIDSVKNIDDVLSNLAFSVCLYSGQMCTAPQNFFIPANVATEGGHISFEEIAEKFKNAINGLATNPKMGAGTLGAIQNVNTLNRAKEIGNTSNAVKGQAISNEEFPNARVFSPTIITCNAQDKNVYEHELFGPIVILIKTDNTAQSIQLAQQMCKNHGAITCAAYATTEAMGNQIKNAMASVFAPVSLNLTGFIWVNQHASFSDFHVTGGNPAGNATFTNNDFVNRRFVWIGHREMIN